jgi:hypothetical protein
MAGGRVSRFEMKRGHFVTFEPFAYMCGPRIVFI